MVSYKPIYFSLHFHPQLNKSTITSHSVYAPAIEKVFLSMWHPSQEELSQESIHQQEVYLKHKIASRPAVDPEVL